MNFQSVTLGSFLALFAGDPPAASISSLINTNNSSFPEKYRCFHERPASLFVEIMKNNDEELFNRKIKRILLLPVDMDIDNIHIYQDKYDFYINFNSGFIDKKTENVLCPAIHIILEDESV